MVCSAPHLPHSCEVGVGQLKSPCFSLRTSAKRACANRFARRSWLTCRNARLLPRTSFSRSHGLNGPSFCFNLLGHPLFTQPGSLLFLVPGFGLFRASFQSQHGISWPTAVGPGGGWQARQAGASGGRKSLALYIVPRCMCFCSTKVWFAQPGFS